MTLLRKIKRKIKKHSDEIRIFSGALFVCVGLYWIHPGLLLIAAGLVFIHQSVFGK